MKEQIEEMKKDLDAIYSTDFKGDYESGLMDIAEALYNAGYRKQKEGEWIWTENGEEDYEQYWVCSCCHEKSYWESKFCSDCGAKMKGEQTKKEYFSPEEVRNMTPKEVRENLAAIMKSMRKWK